MKVGEYLRDVLVPANSAVAAIQRNGLVIDRELLQLTRADWAAEVARLEKLVEDRSALLGVPFKYSAKHGAHPPKVAAFMVAHLIDVGLIANVGEYVNNDNEPLRTPKGGLASDSDSLKRWASLSVPRTAAMGYPKDGFPADDEYTTYVLQIRSLAKGFGTYLDSFDRAIRDDGACHPKYNWALRTSRLSAEDPPVHQIPERSEKRVPDGVKATIAPRRGYVGSGRLAEWDPRKHGSCWRWDISGAEAAWRAACIPYLAESRLFYYADTDDGLTDPIAYDYIRLGKDIHSKTASIIYNVPDGTYKKGSYERDAAGKQTFFAKIFGALPKAVQYSIWDKARLWIDFDKVRDICKNFDAGYAGLTRLYEIDKRMLGLRMDPNGSSWCEDPYGRRRQIQIPPQSVRRWNRRTETWSTRDLDNMWRDVPYGTRPDQKLIDERKKLNHAFHVAANTPTQSGNASDTMWMLSLLHHGEYVDLRVPPMWEREGVLYPEAAGWCLDEGPGPSGKPFLSWHNNTVHDSGWGDCAPGYMEPTAKLIERRCTALPNDWRIAADVPYRVELKCGPNMSQLTEYNKVAKKFGLEPMIR